MRLFRLLLSLVLGPPMLVVGLISTVAAGGPQLQPQDHLLDALTHFAPIYLAVGLANMVVGAVMLGGYRKALVALGLLNVALAAWLMAPEYLRPTGPTAPADAPRQLKLIQFNLWEDNRDLPRTVAWILAQHPDVVAVEEADERVRRLMTAGTGYHAALGDGVMVFSREAPVSVEIPQRPDNQSGAPVARASFHDARGDYTVLATHPPWPIPTPEQQYEGQVLAKVLTRFPRDSLILAGDFNSTPWSFSRQRQDRLFGVIRRDRAVFSWPARLVFGSRRFHSVALLPIDHVYAGAGWATVKVERGPRLGSDHYPLIVTLARLGPP